MVRVNGVFQVRNHWFRKPIKSKLSVRRRAFGMCPNDVVRAKEAKKRLLKVAKAMISIRSSENILDKPTIEEKFKILYLMLVRNYLSIVKPEDDLNGPLRRILRRNNTIARFQNDEIHSIFRFDNNQQLHTLLRVFRPWISRTG